MCSGNLIVLFFISLMANDMILNIFNVLFNNLYILCEMSKYFSNLKNVLALSCKNSVYILNTSLYISMVNIFFQSVAFLIFLTSFEEWKLSFL